MARLDAQVSVCELHTSVCDMTFFTDMEHCIPFKEGIKGGGKLSPDRTSLSCFFVLFINSQSHSPPHLHKRRMCAYTSELSVAK